MLKTLSLEFSRDGTGGGKGFSNQRPLAELDSALKVSQGQDYQRRQAAAPGLEEGARSLSQGRVLAQQGAQSLCLPPGQLLG